MAEAYTGMVDVLFGYDTDIHFKNGDLQLVTGIDYIEREIYKLLITEQGDWGTALSIGSSPNKFIGEPNTRELSSKLENYIESNLQFIVSPARLSARAVPVDFTKIIVIIDITAQGTTVTRVPFEFDFLGGFKKLLNIDEAVTEVKSSQQYQVNDVLTTKTPNKYWNRLRNN